MYSYLRNVACHTAILACDARLALKTPVSQLDSSIEDKTGWALTTYSQESFGYCVQAHQSGQRLMLSRPQSSFGLATGLSFVSTAWRETRFSGLEVGAANEKPTRLRERIRLGICMLNMNFLRGNVCRSLRLRNEVMVLRYGIEIWS
jgi:hypothetical protein